MLHQKGESLSKTAEQYEIKEEMIRQAICLENVIISMR
jgi:hypothetical protein